VKWPSFRKRKKEPETILEIAAGEGNIKTLYVKTNGPEKALELMQKLKELARE